MLNFAASITWKDCSCYVVNMFAMDAYLLGKRLSDALSLAVLNLANSIQCQRTKQRWMLIGVYIFCPRPTLTGYWVLYSIGVGFCVARSTLNGNARAKNSGTSNRYSCPAFSYLCALHHRYLKTRISVRAAARY